MAMYVAVVFTSAGIIFSLYVVQEFLVIFLAGHQKKETQLKSQAAC